MDDNSLAAIQALYTDEEYLAFEREAEEKHELFDGQIIAMAGANRGHNLINVNVSGGLYFGLKGTKNEVYANNMRGRMRQGAYSYPDIVVAGEKPQFAGNEFDVLLNPVLVVEILSKSTRFRDKSEKLETYQKMEGIRECLLIEQEVPRVEQYIKQTARQWILRIYEDLAETISLESIGCELPMAEIYSQIEFKNDAGDDMPEISTN